MYVHVAVAYNFVCVLSCTSGTHTGGTTSSDLLWALLLADTGDRVEVVPVLAVDRLTYDTSEAGTDTIEAVSSGKPTCIGEGINMFT